MTGAGRDPRPASRVAVLQRKGKFLVAEPFFSPGPQMVVSRDRKADVGDLVTVAPGRSANRRGTSRMVIGRRLGRPDVARDVIAALMLDRGLQRGFDPAVDHAAREAAAPPPDFGGRRDLRELPTFTIDPATARDFDDAISAQAGEDGSIRVWVHIADVAAYVPTRGAIDREAYRRGTSVYVPGAVEPMLPGRLSNDVCSLVQGEDRLTVTVEMTIAAGRGSPPTEVARGAAMYRSVIRSVARLDYDHVDRIFAGTERALDPWAQPLADARAAAAALQAGREGQSAVVLQSAEPEFHFDREGHVTGADLVPQTESHRLIERLMIAANEAVAGFLEERRVPTLFRVHERPDASSVERLITQLASLGVPTPPAPGGHMTSQQAADLAAEISAMVADWVARTGRGGRALNRLVLRSLNRPTTTRAIWVTPAWLLRATATSPRRSGATRI